MINRRHRSFAILETSKGEADERTLYDDFPAMDTDFPVWTGEHFRLRYLQSGDAAGLFTCYHDKEAVRYNVSDYSGGETMPQSRAQKDAVMRYQGKTYEPVNIRVLIGERDQINAAARARGESLNAYVRRAIAAQMERDGLPESEHIPATIEQATARRKEQEEQAAKL